MRITRLFVLLALAALLAPRVEASRTSVWGSNPPASMTATKPDSAGLLASLAPAAAADIEAEEPPVFNLGDVVLVERELAREERFNLGPLTLVDLNLLRGPPPSYPETRVRGFELLPPFRVGASARLSLWSRQACGFSCREVASDSRYDPWGLESSGAFTADNPENRELQRRYMAGEIQRTPQERALELATVGVAAGATAGAVAGLGAAAAWPSVSAQWSIGSHWMGTKWFVLANAARGNFDRAVEFFTDLVTPDPRGHPERGAWVPGGARRPKPTVERVNSRLPRNYLFAEETFELPLEIRGKYPSGVQFTAAGFPDFTPYAKARTKIENLTGSYGVDAAKANKAVGFDATPEGYTWHHVEDTQTLLLVPQDLHDAVSHTGGAAKIRGSR